MIERLIENVQWEKTKHDNEKYFGYFENKDEAKQWLRDQLNRYLYTPNPENMSRSRLCNEAQEKGIALHVQTLTRWMNDAGFPMKSGQTPRERTRTAKTYTVSNIVLDELEGYPNKSYLVDLGLRLVLGIPTEDVVVLLPDEDNTTLIFKKKKEGRIVMWTSGTIDQVLEQQLRMLMQRVNQVGMQAVVSYAQTNGYDYYGGTDI